MRDTRTIMSKPMMGAAQQDMMWHAGGQNPSQAHGAVSVVTTVYSNVPRYGAPQGFNTTTMQPGTTPNVFGVGNGLPTGQSYPDTMSKPASYMNVNAYQPYDHQSYPIQPGPPQYGSNVPQQAALNAAQVAAAAVATATATAVAIDRSQFQPYHPGPQSDPYNNMPYQTQTGASPNTYGMSPRTVQPPAQMPYLPAMGSGRVQNNIRYPVVNKNAPMGAPESLLNGQQQAPAPYIEQFPNNAPVAMNQRPPMQNLIRYPTNYSARLPNSRTPHYPMMNIGTPGINTPGASVPQLPAYGQQISHPMSSTTYQNVRSNMPDSAFSSSNPTPPLTPAVGGNMAALPAYNSGPGLVPGSSAPAVDVKPAINTQDETEPRITLQVPDGMLLRPFRLEHNAPVSQHVFVLDDRTYHQLCTDPNLDLQLKCFHADDKTMSNNWPHNANIQICVNGTPVAVRLVERPLYIKSLCQKQKNTLQIAVQQCCCSHLFLLTVVNRPTVDTIVRQLVRSRLVSPEHCIEKIRNFFHSGEVAQMKSVENAGHPEIMQMSINMSLKCPITMKRIELPARGHECRHPQCFDLRSYLIMNRERSTWLCPICKQLAMLDSLEIDQYVWGILTNLNNCDVEEVTIDGTAAWKPLGRQSSNGPLKEEREASCNSVKRFKPDPATNGGNSRTWSQAYYQDSPASFGSQSLSGIGQTLQPPSAGMPGIMYNPNTNALSPYYSGGSPNGSASVTNANPATPAGCHSTPMNNGLNFTGPNTPKQSVGRQTPHNSRCGPSTPATPQQPFNPPSVGPPPKSVGNPPSVDNSAKGTYGSASAYGVQKQQSFQQQSSVDASFSAGSAPYTPVSVTSAGSQSTNTPANTVTETGLDFPDFTFDTSDLLGSGYENQTGTSLFNDPDELMKYLVDGVDFGGYGLTGQSASVTNSSSNVIDERQKSSAQSAGGILDKGAMRNSSLPTSTDNLQQQSSISGHSMNSSRSAESTGFSSIDDVMQFLEK